MFTDGPDQTFSNQSDLLASARHLSLDDFLARYSHPILWVTRPPGSAGHRTENSEPLEPVESYRRTILQGDSLEADPAAAAAYLKKSAQVQKRPNNPFPNMISVGRAGNNDVVIPLGTISKLHAYFLRDQDTWSLTDWNSTNGTTLEGKPLTPRETTPLKTGAKLSFGKEFWATFIHPSDLYEELRSPTPFADSLVRESAN